MSQTSVRALVGSFVFVSPALAQLALAPVPGTSPSPRSFAVASVIAGTGDRMLFGGLGVSGVTSETWRVSTSGWSLIPTVSTPSARSHAAIGESAFPVLFGGRDGSGAPLGDTWRFVHGPGAPTWTHWPVSGPPAREQSAMCTSSGFGAEHVLFGGRNAAQVFGDTWTFDSVGWTQQALAVAPPARYGHAMAARNFGGQRQAILFGGRDAQGNLLDDTWVLAAVTAGAPVWTPFTPVVHPSARVGHAMRYDVLRDRVQLFGGRDSSGVLGDLWEWNGAGWTLTAASGPAPREGAVLVDAPDSLSVGLLYGGAAAGAPLGDAWAAISVTPPSRVAFGPLPTLQFSISTIPQTAAVPWLGDTIQLQLSSPIGSMVLPHVIVGFSNTTSTLGSLPLDLGPLFDHQPLLVAPDQLFAMPPTSPFSVLSTAVPPTPALAGVHVYLQGIAFTPSLGGGRWSVSIGYDCTFGLR